MKLALWAMQVRRDRERLVRARDTIAVGKLSGAVGTFSNVDPAVERYVCEHLGLTPVPATQVLPRDRHAEVLYACASIGASIESFALEIRHLQRTEVREAEEAFREGRRRARARCRTSATRSSRSSSAGSRACCAATCRPALEDVALWHERDISHSSVERIIVPDSLMLAYYVIVQFTKVISRPARASRAHAAQPRRVVRSRVQPAGAARARRGRREPRRRVPDRAAQRDAGVAGGAVVPRAARGRSRSVAPCSTTRGSTRASTSSARSPTSAAPSTSSIGSRRPRCPNHDG